jgi:hypothetical protein
MPAAMKWEAQMAFKTGPAGVVAMTLMCFLATGCVSTKTVPLASKGSELKGKSIIVVQHERPSFTAMTAGKMAVGGLFGAVGGAVAGASIVSAGNKIVDENHVEDPTPQLAHAIATDLAVFDDLTVHESKGVIAKTSDPAELVKLYPGNDLILDVYTTMWSFGYFPTNWSHYKVFYAVKLRLIRASDSKVLAEGFCNRGNEQTADSAPTYDELLANNASLLKHRLGDLSQACGKELKDKVFVL